MRCLFLLLSLQVSSPHRRAELIAFFLSAVMPGAYLLPGVMLGFSSLYSLEEWTCLTCPPAFSGLGIQSH